MSLPDEISAAIMDAMRRQDQPRLVPLRMLKTALTNRAIEIGRALNDAVGRVMKATMSRLAGLTVDGKAVSDAVRAKLGGQ